MVIFKAVISTFVLQRVSRQHVITTMTYILDQIEKIRDFINSPRKQHLILGQISDWNKLCSSLDVVGDTELAIESYLKEAKPRSVGETYLVIYGILQVLYVQQDAIKHIAESLHLKYEPDQLLQSIRDARNDSVGHPTHRGKGDNSKFNFINRSSMTATGFQLITTYSDRTEATFTEISVPKLIESQREILQQLLTNIIQLLRKEEMDHKKEFKNEKLADIFPHTLYYYCDKIGESILGKMPKSSASGMVDLINEHITEYKDALSKRGLLEALDKVKFLFDELAYPLDKLKRHFDNAEQSELDDKDARIFIFFVRKHLQELREIAKEIDQEYEKEL